MLSDTELKKFAAESCRREIERLNLILQELEAPSGPRRGRPAQAASQAPTGRTGTRKGMSAAARKAVSLRMKKMWADRKKKKDA